jgi:hypothetical protein
MNDADYSPAPRYPIAHVTELLTPVNYPGEQQGSARHQECGLPALVIEQTGGTSGLRLSGNSSPRAKR